jgi:negative modulator of initiation of replication
MATVANSSATVNSSRQFGEDVPVVELDPDVYGALLRRTQWIGEDASSILRRELNLPAVSAAVNGAAAESARGRDEELDAFLRGPLFLRAANVTERYLGLLGWIARRDPEHFEQDVLVMRGRKRRYFGRTREEIERSGNSTHPHPIPGTAWWAMTNADTAWKRDRIHDVMQVLGYAPAAVDAAANAVR